MTTGIVLTGIPAAIFGPGSAAAPSFTFSTDATSGLFLKAGSSLGISTGGVEAGSITSGSWSIGLSTDSTQLHYVYGRRFYLSTESASASDSNTVYWYTRLGQSTNLGTVYSIWSVALKSDSEDTGTAAVQKFQVFKPTAGAITTRPLFSFLNNTTEVASCSAGGGWTFPVVTTTTFGNTTDAGATFINVRSKAEAGSYGIVQIYRGNTLWRFGHYDDSTLHIAYWNGSTITDMATSTTAGAWTLGPEQSLNYLGPVHQIAGHIASRTPTSGASSDSGYMIISANYKDANYGNRYDATPGGVGIVLRTQTTAANAALSFRTNKPGDLVGTAGVEVGFCTHNGAWNFGPSTGLGAGHNFNAHQNVVLYITSTTGGYPSFGFYSGANQWGYLQIQADGAFYFMKNSGTLNGYCTTSGAWTLGPSSTSVPVYNVINGYGLALTVKHVNSDGNGNTALTVDSSAVSSSISTYTAFRTTVAGSSTIGFKVDGYGQCFFGPTVSLNWSGVIHRISGHLAVNTPSAPATDESGFMVISSNLKFSTYGNRFNTSSGGAGIMFDTRLADSGAAIGFYANQVGDNGLDADEVGRVTHAGSWTLGVTSAAAETSVTLRVYNALYQSSGGQGGVVVSGYGRALLTLAATSGNPNVIQFRNQSGTQTGLGFVSSTVTVLSCTDDGRWTIGPDVSTSRYFHRLASSTNVTPSRSMTFIYDSSSAARWDTGLTNDVNGPVSIGTYLVGITWNPNPAGSGSYACASTGILTVYCGYNGSSVCLYAAYTPIISATSPGLGITINSVGVNIGSTDGGTGVGIGGSQVIYIKMNVSGGFTASSTSLASIIRLV